MGSIPVSADPLRPAARATSPWKGEELQSHRSPKGELPAKPGEGVNPPRRSPPYRREGMTTCMLS